jgi:hypothetical protein
MASGATANPGFVAAAAPLTVRGEKLLPIL